MAECIKKISLNFQNKFCVRTVLWSAMEDCINFTHSTKKLSQSTYLTKPYEAYVIAQENREIWHESKHIFNEGK